MTYTPEQIAAHIEMRAAAVGEDSADVRILRQLVAACGAHERRTDTDRERTGLMNNVDIGDKCAHANLTVLQWYAGQALPAVIAQCANDTPLPHEDKEDMFARRALLIAVTIIEQLRELEPETPQ